MLISSQRTLTIYVGVVALCHQHHTTQRHNFHKHSQSSATSLTDIQTW